MVSLFDDDLRGEQGPIASVETRPTTHSNRPTPMSRDQGVSGG